MSSHDSRNKKKSIFIAFLLIIFLFVWMLFFDILSFASQDISIEQEKGKLMEIEKRKEDIKQELEKLKREEADYQNSLKKIQGLLDTAQKELKTTQSSYQKVNKQIAQLEEELEIEQGKLDLQLIILENRLKKFYKYNNITYLAVLLNSKDFSQFLNRYRYLEKIVENDAMVVNEIDKQVQTIKKQKESLYNKKEITELLQSEMEKEKENIQLSLQAKNQYISKIEEEKKIKANKLEELEKSSAQIKGIIELAYREKVKLQNSQKQPKDKIANQGITLQPKKGIFQLPVTGKIISSFGKQKQEDLNTYVFNSGIDISAALGEGIRAASFGTVIYVGNIKGYGEIIIIDHGGNTTTLYAHLSKVLVKQNDQVKKGQIIGQAGSSGGVSSPRLHFEVRLEGKPADPFDWL